MTGPSKYITTTAPSRGLSTSPVRSLSPTAIQRMPSPRNSPAIRPSSPLSPRHEQPNRFEGFRPPSPRNMSTRTGNTQRRANTNSLKLPSLPRFHPANFASAQSSAQSTPDSTGSSPHPPSSPRSHQRVVSDAQKQLFAYQREMLSMSVRSSTPTQLEGPESPRLAPLGSPGPVTPLELTESEGGYLMTSGWQAGNENAASDELVDKLMIEETKRQRRASNNHSPSRPALASR